MESSFKKLAETIGFDFCSPLQEVSLHGSPERTLFRMAVQTERGVFVLERFPNESFLRKKAIAEILHQLAKNGMHHILPPLGSSGEDSIFLHENTFCQLTPYVPGIPLPRPSYVYDAWRGAELASFLINLRQQIPPVPKLMPDFSLLQFGREFLHTLEERDPSVFSNISSFWGKVEKELDAVHDRLPRVFSHGDLHCMNVIWGENKLLFVIDWEFCGLKAENYDMANFLGCIGMEDPGALDGPMVEAFLERIALHGLLSEAGWESLVPTTLAIRFAWLSEWLRKGDTEMIALETDYMALLASKTTELHHLWNSIR